jgi:Leucine-rich repeat (LRR) protein
MNYYQKYLKYKNKYLQLQKGGCTTPYRNTLTKIIRYIIIDLIASNDDKKLLLYNIIIYGVIIIFSKIEEVICEKEQRITLLRNIIQNILDIIKSNTSSVLHNQLYRFVKNPSVIDSIFFYYKFYSEIINLNIDSFLYKNDLYSINEFFNLIFILIKCNNVHLCNIYLNNRISINTNIVTRNIEIPNFLIENKHKLLHYLNSNVNNKIDNYENSNPPTLQSNLDYKSLNFNFTLFKLGELNNYVDIEPAIIIDNLQNINIIYDTNNINNIIRLVLNANIINNPKLNIFEILYNCIDDIDILNNIFSECYESTVFPTRYHVIRNTSDNQGFMDNAHQQEILNIDVLEEPIFDIRNGKELIHNLLRPHIASYNNMYKLDFFRSSNISLDAHKPQDKSTFWLYPSLTDHPGILLKLNNYNRTINLLSLNIGHCNLFHGGSHPTDELIPLDPNISYYFKRVFKIFYLLIKVFNKENIEICFLQEFLQHKELKDINETPEAELNIQFRSSSVLMLEFLQNLLNLIGYRIYSTLEPGLCFNAIICKNNYIVEEIQTHLLKGTYISNTFYCSLKYKNRLDLGKLRRSRDGRDTIDNVNTFDLYTICNIAYMFNLQRSCDKIVIMGDFNLSNTGNIFLGRSLFTDFLILSGEIFSNLDHALVITREQFNNILNIAQVRNLLDIYFRQILIDFYSQAGNNIHFRNIYAPAYQQAIKVYIPVVNFVDKLTNNNDEFQKWLRVYCKLINEIEYREGRVKFAYGKGASLSYLFDIADSWYGRAKDGTYSVDLNAKVPDNGKIFSLINYLQSLGPPPVNAYFNLPANFSQNIINLNHSNGDKYKILKTNNFSRFINLEELTIKNFDIKQIQYNAFTTSLIKLNLSNNEINELQPGIFDNLSLLEQLDLSNNKIRVLQPLYMYTIPKVGIKLGIFDNLQNLKNLDLSNNKIKELQPCIFDNLPLLQELNLENNEIEILPRHIFDNLPLLLQLNLDDNKILELPQHIFDKLELLQQLKLDNNEIRGFSHHIFDKLQLLEILYLSNNQIQELKSGTFNNLPKLETLYLSYNQIQKLKSGTFNNLPALEILFLEHNKIIKVQPGTFNNLPALKTLYLSNNQIQELHSNIFNYITKLTNLYLDNNQIQEFNSDIFNNLIKLEYLYLNNNKIKELSPNIFNNLHSLSYLAISPNEELDILPPNIFSSLERLENLEIYMNREKYNKPLRFYGIGRESTVKII